MAFIEIKSREFEHENRIESVLKKRYQLLLIAVVVLSVFYPTLFAEFCWVDDQQMLASLKNVQHISLKDIFIPGASGGLYYRPFILLSFLFDNFVFGLDSFGMHLHNVVLHLLNAILVFFLSRRVVISLNADYPWLPLVNALVFALHPITTESVNWISGRTDLLAGSFLLSCAIALLDYRQERRRYQIIIASLLFLGAVLTKEFSLAFLPGFIWLVASSSSENGFHLHRLRSIMIIAVTAFCVVGAVLLLRKLAFSSNNFRIRTTLLIIFNTPIHSYQMVMTAFGFYLKKLFIPLPLNFAIYEVNALYEIAAYPLVAVCAYIAWRRTLLSILFITGILLFTPSFVNVFNQIAWSPFAERYLYLSSAFITLASLTYFRKNLHFPNEWSRRLTVLLILCLFTVCTFSRNLVWQTGLGLARDTVDKSSECQGAHYELATFLCQRGEFDAARRYILSGNSVSGFGYDPQGDILMAKILAAEKKPDEALELFEKAYLKSKKRSFLALEGMISVYDQMLSSGAFDKIKYRKLIFETRRKLYRQTRNSELLYDLGLDAQALGNEEKAKMYFKLAVENIPLKDPKSSQAKMMLKKM